MYGRGHYAPQFGQGLQRPMPPYQQQPPGHPSASVFQPGNSGPLQHVNHPGGPPPHGVPPRGPAYLHAPPAPLNMLHQGPPGSTTNSGQPYLHRPPIGHSGGPTQLPYPSTQQSFVPGSQNLHHPPPPPPPPSMDSSRVPPPPPFMQLPPTPRAPPPPAAADLFSPANSESDKQQSTEAHMSSIASQPPPLPPSSPPRAPPPPSILSSSSPGKFLAPSNTAARSPSEFIGNITTHSHKSSATQMSNEDVTQKQSILLDLPPPPPKPADESVVRNIKVLCQFIAKNGPEFEEMARKKESGNPEFNFLVGGDPGSEASRSHEYFLWMKKKCSLEKDLHKGEGLRDFSQRHIDVEPSAGPNPLLSVRTDHSPADSDVDMEDDITQSDKEHGVYHSVEDIVPDPVLAGDLCESQKQENEKDLLYLRGNSPALKSSPEVIIQASAETKPKKLGDQPTDIHSPFRLIQNYASDDSSDDRGEPCRENVKDVVISPLGKSGDSSYHDDMEQGNMNSKRGMIPDRGLDQSVTGGIESVLMKDKDGLLDKSTTASYVIDNREGRDEGSKPNAIMHEKYGLGNISFNSISSYKDVEKEEKKCKPTAAKVDEFGRLIKEGASESESEDSHHLRRRVRRDRSRSQSPSDRRRRRSPRRSPCRRKERRSRSRSWSPKRRRSRSRSPYRPGGDSRSEKLRRGKGQTQECFDFLKGRCYRGASCRYMHLEVGKNENSRRYNSKQYQTDIVGSVSNSDKLGGSARSKSPHEHNDMKGEKMHLNYKHDNCDLASQTCDERSRTESIDISARPSASDVKQCDSSRMEDQVPGASDEPIPCLPVYEDYLSSLMPPTIEQVIHHPQAEVSTGANDKVKEEPQNMGMSLKISASEPNLDEMPNASAPDFPHQVTQLPPPPLPQATNASQGPNVPSVSVPPQSVPVESGPLYQASLPNQQSNYPVPPNPTWSSLLQSRPPHIVSLSVPSTALQFQQGNFSLRNDFSGQMSLRAHPGELPGQSQVGGFPNQSYHVPSSSFPAQPFARPNLVRDDRYSQFPIQGLVPSTSFVTGVASQPVPFSGDSAVKNTDSFSGDNLRVGESSKQSLQNHQLSQQRPPPFGPHLTAAESMSSHLGGSLSVPWYSSNTLDRGNPSSFLDGGSRISTHYNPYASTFDQPLSTRFSSVAFTQEREAVGSMNYDGQTVGDHGSRQIISSSNSLKAGGQTLPNSGGDQYDPLFDSINPLSESVKNLAQKQDHAADNSDLLKLSSRHNVLDVEENNKQKVVGAVAASVSLEMENDEFGETADAEVGAVENESPSIPNEDAHIAEGDIEIDQVKPEGRTKKNKDSRSMKLFKIAVANFVKDVLKPQWRQGNMSKEVFKTIVKKTVDKVSGAMKNHRVPKSQAKIDHYIDSSRRKLTQLVEGYVDKYNS